MTSLDSVIQPWKFMHWLSRVLEGSPQSQRSFAPQLELLEDRCTPSTIMPGTRNPADWPFDRYSPWNTPIGSGAQYTTINSPGFSVNGGAFISWDQYSIPVYKASNSDPLRTITQGGQFVTQIHVPDSATPAPGSDAIMTIVAPDGKSSVEMWRANRLSDMNIDAVDVGLHDLTSKFETNWQAPRASGLSSLGGLIRTADLTTFDDHIHHALAFASPRAAWNANAPGGLNWIWPALGADDGTGVGYSNSGNLYLGSLVAIPKSFDINSLGLPAHSLQYEIALALQNYGAYGVDSTSDNMDFYVQQNIDQNVMAAYGLPNTDSQYGQFATDLASIIQHLVVVSNNGPSSVGGGGTPLEPLAPDFAGAQASTASMILSSLNPANYGQSVTFTATVSSSTAGSITGTVSFLDGSTTLGTATLSSGHASFTTTALAAGTHSISADYSGDSNYLASNSPAFSETIAKDNTTTSLTASADPASFGQAVTFTATLTSSAGPVPGTVTFKDGSTTLGTANLSGGKATFTTSSLAVGSHSIAAIYGGSTNFNSSSSAALSETIAKANSSASLTASVNPAGVGQAVTFTATIRSATSGTPTGTVTFKDGGSTLGTANLSGGKATFTTSSLAASSHSITAIYGGSGNFNGSSSAALIETISAAPPATTQVNLSGAFNQLGITTDGSTFSASGGLDVWGDALSSNLLGSTVNWNSRGYNLGPANVNNVVRAAGQTINLPAGNYSTLSFLATGVNGNQLNQTFTVTYTDGTTQTFTQSLSDWFTPENFSGESRAVAMGYRNQNDGTRDSRPFYVYGYSLALNSGKTVKSITLPTNSNVLILAMDLTV
jgi:hypothetical protein